MSSYPSIVFISDLYQGHAVRNARELDLDSSQLSPDQADSLCSEITFFSNHWHRIRYLEYREEGWLISSRSGCKWTTLANSSQIGLPPNS